MPKTVDEQQAEIFMDYAKKRLKNNLQKIESMTPKLQKHYEFCFDIIKTKEINIYCAVCGNKQHFGVFLNVWL